MMQPSQPMVDSGTKTTMPPLPMPQFDFPPPSLFGSGPELPFLQEFPSWAPPLPPGAPPLNAHPLSAPPLSMPLLNTPPPGVHLPSSKPPGMEASHEIGIVPPPLPTPPPPGVPFPSSKPPVMEAPHEIGIVPLPLPTAPPLGVPLPSSKPPGMEASHEIGIVPPPLPNAPPPGVPLPSSKPPGMEASHEIGIVPPPLPNAPPLGVPLPSSNVAGLEPSRDMGIVPPPPLLELDSKSLSQPVGVTQSVSSVPQKVPPRGPFNDSSPPNTGESSVSPFPSSISSLQPQELQTQEDVLSTVPCLPQVEDAAGEEHPQEDPSEIGHHVSLRPVCAVAAFSFGGSVVCTTTPSGNMQECTSQNIFADCLPQWYSDLEAFPGPLAEISPATTAALIQNLDHLAEYFSGETPMLCTALESAVDHPLSVALMCQFLKCLIKAGGKRQSDEFWALFAPVLISRSCLPPSLEELTPLQRFCLKLAYLDVVGALEEACSSSLWPHALIVSQLISQEAYCRVLSQIGMALQNLNVQNYVPTEVELADPLVMALSFLFQCLGEGDVPEISEKIVTSWPTYVGLIGAIFWKCGQQKLAEAFLEAVAGALAKKGDIFGAHICHLLASERSLEAVDNPSALVCLLGVEHRNPKNFIRLRQPLALQLSEAFEYALRCRDSSFLCPSITPFKFTHAMMLAEAGLIEKAQKYSMILPAFVKAAPQNRVSDAFRSGLRELHEILNPDLTGPSETQGIGNLMKGLFRGFAETTGLAVKPTPPPALPEPDAESNSASKNCAPIHSVRPLQPKSVNFPPRPPPIGPPPAQSNFSTPGTSLSMGEVSKSPVPSHTNLPRQEVPELPTVSQTDFVSPLARRESDLDTSAPPRPHQNYVGMGKSLQADEYTMGCTSHLRSTQPVMTELERDTAPRAAEPRKDAMGAALEQDPLLNAGKAVWSGVKGLFSAVIQQPPPPTSAPAPPPEPAYFYDNERKMWRRPGEAVPDASEYDPMTGQKLPPKVTETPPTLLPPPPMGAAPARGLPLGDSSMGGGPSLGVSSLCAGVPFGGLISAHNRPTSLSTSNNERVTTEPGVSASPFPMPTHASPFANQPVSSPFGSQQQGAMKMSPF